MSIKSSIFRLRFLEFLFLFLFTSVVLRLFYWQILKSPELQNQASAQYEREFALSGSRGKILSSDGYLLVGNQAKYRLFAEKKLLEEDPEKLAEKLSPLLVTETEDYQVASTAAERETISANFEESLRKKLSSKRNWLGILTGISESKRQEIEKLELGGFGFEEYEERFYPEASMAAQLLGFVGKDEKGQDIGYFGLEGRLENELKGIAIKKNRLADALGFNLLFKQDEKETIDGRDIVLTIRRDIQLLAENTLLEGIERYGAEKGEIIILEPQTGKILGMASYPNYEPEYFYRYPPEYYKNPSAANSYEPGSTLKVLTVAAGIEEKVIKPETECPRCDEARQIGKYTIRTWNDEYNPNISMQDALAKSDNTAMIYIAEELGTEKFQEYLQRFGLGEDTGIELQEETIAAFPEKWGAVELATRSFGQGIAISSLQLCRAISSIANGGVMHELTLVESVKDHKTGEELHNEIYDSERVLSKESAQTVARMMQYAAEYGEAQWVSRKDYTVAGKTGTSQVAEAGEYLKDQTITSFIGFSPVEKAKFLAFVKLENPQSSPWAAETAAPLWYELVDRLQLLLD